MENNQYNTKMSTGTKVTIGLVIFTIIVAIVVAVY
jgi:hypothetical protein